VSDAGNESLRPPESTTLEQPPSRLERRFEPGLERTANVLGSLVALLLLTLVCVALVGMVLTIVKTLVKGDFNQSVSEGLDAAFLIIILLELVHTTLVRGPISNRVQEFLLVGITAGVRSGLEVAANRGDARIVGVNLAIDAAAVLLLVAALWLVRQRVRT
jgi:hypothetical protein